MLPNPSELSIPTEAEIYTEGTNVAQAYLRRLDTTLREIPLWQLCKAAKYLRKIHAHNGTIWCAGNGGSQANAAHLSLHLQEHGYAALDMMGEGAMLSALSNDYTYEAGLARLLRLRAKEHDGLVIFTGSGNSINILAALAEANRQQLSTIGILGSGGGMSRELVRVPIILQTKEYGPVEDAHSAVIHILSEMLGMMTHGPPLK